MKLFNPQRTKVRRSLLALVVAGLGLAPWTADAGTATSSFTVTGSVIANCTISTTGISFTYDPVVANASADAVGTGGTVVIACTKGSGPTIGLDPGKNSAAAAPLLAGASRAMAMTVGGTTSYLQYDIHWQGTSTSWGNAGAALFNPGAPASKAPRTFNMDAIAIRGQDVPVGTYTDNVLATVNF